MSNYIVVRAHKCADWGDGNKAANIRGVGGQTKHDLRLIETPNADPARREENLICSSDTGWKLVRLTDSLAAEIGADREDFFAAKAKERMARLGIAEPQRADVVRVINFIAAVSPAWLRNGDESGPPDPDKSRQFSEAAAEFFRIKYGENFLGCLIHMDELNPHCSAYILPAVHMVRRAAGRPRKKSPLKTPAQPEATWGLRAKSLLSPDQRVKNGDEKERIYDSGSCSKLQTEFAAFCRSKGLNVVRGIHGSRAKHKSIAEHNHLLRSAVVLEENIAAIDDKEELRKIALQNLLKAREQDELVARLRASSDAERKAMENAAVLQKRLRRERDEKEAIQTDFSRILLAKCDDAYILRRLVERLRKEFKITAVLVAELVAKGYLYANRLGHVVLKRFDRKQLVGCTIEDLDSRRVWDLGPYGVAQILRPKPMISAVVAARPLEALAIASLHAAEHGNGTGVFLAGPPTDESRDRALKMGRPGLVTFALSDDPQLAVRMQIQAKSRPDIHIVRPPDGTASWLELLSPKKPQPDVNL